MPGRRKVTEQKSDRNGIAIFRNIDLTQVPWSVSIYNLTTTSVDNVKIIASPEIAARQHIRPDVASLPAEITIYIRKLGFTDSWSICSVVHN
jgi:hypothetical protein